MATVSVRYFVRDIDAAIDFYCQLLDFHVAMHPNASFAMLSRGDLRLVLSVPGGGPGGGQAMPDGRLPEPGGWNRFQLEVADLAATVETLRGGERTSAAISSSASASTRSWSTTPPATRSRSTSR